MSHAKGTKAATESEAKAPSPSPRPAKTTPEQLRRHERMSFEARVTLYELDSDGVPGTPGAADGSDLSRSGMGVRARRMYYTDRVVLVRIPLRSGGAYFKCGVIRSTSYSGDGMYHIGIEFREMPPGEGIASWVRARQMSAHEPH